MDDDTSFTIKMYNYRGKKFTWRENDDTKNNLQIPGIVEKAIRKSACMGIVYPMLLPSTSVLDSSLTPPSSLSPWQACEPNNTRGNKNKQYYDMTLFT